MADSDQGNEKKPVLKSVFQWAAAVLAPFGCEAPQTAYDQAGLAYDYYKPSARAGKPPKVT